MLKHFNNIIIQFLIKRQLAKTKLSGRQVSFKTAKKVGIIAYLDSKDRLNEVVNFKKRIEVYGSRVVAIGYVPHGVVPDYFNTQMQTDVFSRKQVNLLGIPKGDFVRNFLSEDFDIFIDLTLDDHLPLTYLAGMARARLKAGRYRENMLHVYDFMIKEQEGKSYGDFLFALKNYLNILNNSTL
jgi:hypothetical protein